jgi:phosphatidylinositol kinase/protein kinase (PI-3  family)
MSRLLRENNRVLAMVLAIFVQEPLIDPDETGGVSAAASGIMTKPLPNPMRKADESAVITSQEVTRRIKQKLTGRDFGDDVQLSVDEQATRLIEMATDNYSLSRMYSGWCPFW